MEIYNNIAEKILKMGYNIKDFKIISSIYVNDSRFEHISMLDRLFSWPWRPWVKVKSWEDPKVYLVIDDKQIIVSPKTYSIIQKEAANDNHSQLDKASEITKL